MKIKYLPGQRIAYRRQLRAYGPQNRTFMTDFKAWVEAKNLFLGSTILGLALDNPQQTPASACRYEVGLVTKRTDFLLPIKQRIIPGNKYAIFSIAHTVGPSIVICQLL
ncbi:GyrI-like domain-containing protein [Lactobacillus sp. DCY120]|uniref:GyrI-like domain-containing protein n=1 Tax=Bombilactobacillus apium TaxID=2675299 RepID=A0A850R7V7_9LACO|nr:GyrI-like domain-containing protein [Bombilactobacillus apium]NVY96615.1 GyrI-like domain-containing protein [Bombilactobacillus apium]